MHESVEKGQEIKCQHATLSLNAMLAVQLVLRQKSSATVYGPRQHGIWAGLALVHAPSPTPPRAETKQATHIEAIDRRMPDGLVGSISTGIG